MKNSLLITLTLLFVAACGSGTANKDANTQEIVKSSSPDAVNVADAINVADSNTVYVYYFHGKHRCKTCIAVEKVVKETIDSNYMEKPNVKLMVVLTDEPANKALVEKYEISWNSLIIARGDNSANITEEAFANAIKKPEALAELIKQEVNSRL